MDAGPDLKFGDKTAPCAWVKNKGKGKGKGQRKGQDKKGGDKTKAKSDDDAPMHWKKVPPAAGQPETMKKSDRTWYWCGKCKRWTNTHSTSQHVKKGTTAPTSSSDGHVSSLEVDSYMFTPVINLIGPDIGPDRQERPRRSLSGSRLLLLVLGTLYAFLLMWGFAQLCFTGWWKFLMAPTLWSIVVDMIKHPKQWSDKIFQMVPEPSPSHYPRVRGHQAGSRGRRRRQYGTIARGRRVQGRPLPYPNIVDASAWLSFTSVWIWLGGHLIDGIMSTCHALQLRLNWMKRQIRNRGEIERVGIFAYRRRFGSPLYRPPRRPNRPPRHRNQSRVAGNVRLDRTTSTNPVQVAPPNIMVPDMPDAPTYPPQFDAATEERFSEFLRDHLNLDEESEEGRPMREILTPEQVEELRRRYMNTVWVQHGPNTPWFDHPSPVAPAPPRPWEPFEGPHERMGNWREADLKKTPPLWGETTRKIGDVVYQWCAKCQRWTKTHWTATHREPDTPHRRVVTRNKRRTRNSVMLGSLAVETYEETTYKTTFPVAWDSGASISVSFDKNDFVGPIREPGTQWQRLSGVVGSNNIEVKGVGEVAWIMEGTDGKWREIMVPAVWIPKARRRLLSTSGLMAKYSQETISQNSDGMTLSGLTTDYFVRGSIQAKLDPTSNVPTTMAHARREPPNVNSQTRLTDSQPQSWKDVVVNTLTSVSRENGNLSDAEKELIRWHNRLGHCGFRGIQFLMRGGRLSNTDQTRRLHTSCCRLETAPRCASCVFGKQRNRGASGVNHRIVRDREQVLSAEKLLPGQRISVDHFENRVRGRLLDSYGKEKESLRYIGGAIFVDSASKYVHVVCQVSFNSTETIRSKEKFEGMCRDVGVIPQEYLTDNGKAFTSAGWSKHLSQFHQVHRLSGVGAHHHNGIAERHIRTIMGMARTMLLHANMHWPDMKDLSLWPMAVHYAVFIWNRMPSVSTGLCPFDIFTQTRWPQRRFHDFHVWGCPVYVLAKKIADGQKLPRWEPRSERCIFMGFSLDHATSVPLVLKPDTGKITAQYNVVFDDWFSTIATDVDDLPSPNDPEWINMFGLDNYITDEDLRDNMSFGGATESEGAHLVQVAQRNRTESAMEAPAVTLPVPPPPTDPDFSSKILRTPSSTHSSVSPQQHEGAHVGEKRNRVQFGDNEIRHFNDSDNVSSSMPVPNTSAILEETVASPILRHKPPSIGNESSRKTSAIVETSLPSPRAPLVSVRSLLEPASSSGQAPSSTRASTANEGVRRSSRPSNSTFRYTPSGLGQGPVIALLDPEVLSAAKSRNDPDTFTWDQAMKSEYRMEFIAAALAEIRSLEEKGSWIEEHVDCAGQRIIPVTWVFRIKRLPDGTVLKFKARFCVRGDLQDGEFETYAPVVSGESVRLFLILAITWGWVTCSVDFANAFVQSALAEPIWIQLPRGFHSKHAGKTCLKLKKSLYGTKIAPRLWAQTLFKALSELGFKPCKHDQCFWVKPGMMVVVYVDDCGVAAKNMSDIDKFVADLRSKGFDLTKEGSFTAFLGISFNRNEDGTIVLTQKGLIKKLLEASGMEACKGNSTPASTNTLGSNPDSDPMDESWSYPSIVGMLIYLATHTRPDISFAVSQVARFSANPKQVHASAVKTIIRYLAKTYDKGIIMAPNGELNVECYVDSDFAGLYNSEPHDNPAAAKSRTGYMIFLGNCPWLWKSCLQTTVSTSTCEAETDALATLMRVICPQRLLLIEVLELLNLPIKIGTTIIYEDNNATLSLAVNQRITSRTRHFLVKSHYIFEALGSGDFEVRRVDTDKQRANILTKGLARDAFERERKMTQGW